MKYTLSVHAGAMVYVMRSTCAVHAGISGMQISTTDAEDVRNNAAYQTHFFQAQKGYGDRCACPGSRAFIACRLLNLGMMLKSSMVTHHFTAKL